MEKAEEYFSKAADLCPNSGSYTKYLHLGQLRTGKNAENAYQKAVKLMEKESKFQKVISYFVCFF